MSQPYKLDGIENLIQEALDKQREAILEKIKNMKTPIPLKLKKDKSIFDIVIVETLKQRNLTIDEIIVTIKTKL